MLYLSAYNVIAKSRGQLHAVYIITEYAQGGDLLKLLLRKDTPLGWRFRIQIAKEVSGNLVTCCLCLCRPYFDSVELICPSSRDVGYLSVTF